MGTKGLTNNKAFYQKHACRGIVTPGLSHTHHWPCECSSFSSSPWMSVKWESEWLRLHWWLTETTWPLLCTCCVTPLCELWHWHPWHSLCSERFQHIYGDTQTTYTLVFSVIRLKRRFKRQATDTWATDNWATDTRASQKGDWQVLCFCKTLVWTLAAAAGCRWHGDGLI